MNILAIVGSPRKGKSTDILIDKALEGVKSKKPASNITKLNLIDYNIQYCRNCLVCRDTKTDQPVAQCTIRDDMDKIVPDIIASDYLIFGTPVHMGYATGLIMTFLERICWPFAKPERKILTMPGCPMPRSNKTRKAIIIVTSGIVPPIFRMFCDQATPLIKGTLRDSLNTRTVGTLYAGALEVKGVSHYYDKAFNLGKRLVR